MSTTIKPTQGVIYECYKGFTDRYGDYCRPGQKFKWSTEFDESEITGDYVMEKASGRGVNIAVEANQFAAHFCPAAENEVNNEVESKVGEFKIGDKVRIKPSSGFYGTSFANPSDMDGVIKEIRDEYLGILVEWENHHDNSYDAHDLELVDEAEYEWKNNFAAEMINALKGLEDQIENQLKLKNMNIVITSTDEILELAKVPFLKDQIESRFPELFVKHKVGNRYRHEDGNCYILIKGRVSNQVALVNLETGEMESYKVEVNDTDQITIAEFKGLCLDTERLTLIRERQ